MKEEEGSVSRKKHREEGRKERWKLTSSGEGFERSHRPRDDPLRDGIVLHEGEER